MLKKIKYVLSFITKDKQVLLRIVCIIAALTVALSNLLHGSIHTINIFDGKKTYTVLSPTSNVAMVMDTMAFDSKNYKIVKSETGKNTTEVDIRYTFPVYITRGEETKEVYITGGTVEDALKVAGFNPDKYDFTHPALDTELKDTTYIDYTDIEYVKSTETKKIPYKTKKTYSKSLKAGDKKITTQGKDGLKEVTYTEKLVNGVSVKKEATKTVTLSKAVDQKVKVGVKAKPAKKGDSVSTLAPKTKIELDKNGVPLNYKSKMKVRATAYTHTGNRCATGVKPQPGYIAVNPKIIPYGTEMFIKTTDGKYIYGYAVAADTGGFIKKHPTGVDLFFDTEEECIQFGVRTAEIYILN
jgi:uncharacterized protein YabE (DUF348 family)